MVLIRCYSVWWVGFRGKGGGQFGAGLSPDIGSHDGLEGARNLTPRPELSTA